MFRSKACRHCGYSRLAHKEVAYSSTICNAYTARDVLAHQRDDKYPLADNPCHNYKADNLRYLEELDANSSLS